MIIFPIDLMSWIFKLIHNQLAISLLSYAQVIGQHTSLPVRVYIWPALTTVACIVLPSLLSFLFPSLPHQHSCRQVGVCATVVTS